MFPSFEVLPVVLLLTWSLRQGECDGVVCWSSGLCYFVVPDFFYLLITMYAVVQTGVRMDTGGRIFSSHSSSSLDAATDYCLVKLYSWEIAFFSIVFNEYVNVPHLLFQFFLVGCCWWFHYVDAFASLFHRVVLEAVVYADWCRWHVWKHYSVSKCFACELFVVWISGCLE